MSGAHKPLLESSRPALDEGEAPSSSDARVPVSVTRQRRMIEPWKVLELGKRDAREPARQPVRAHDKVFPRRNVGGGALNAAFMTAGVTATAAVWWRFVHRVSGFDLSPRVHAALEGRTFLASCVAALVTLAVTLTLAILAVRARPRSPAFSLAALGMLLVSISFTFIALTTGSRETVGMTGDAVTLIVGSLPFVAIGLALRVLRNGWIAGAEREGLERESVFFAAALATAIALVGVETLFGAGLGRLLRAL